MSLRSREYARQFSDRETAEKQVRQEKFNELLQNRFADFKQGQFESSIPKIDSISIIRGPASKETGEVNNLFIYPYYIDQDGKRKKIDLTLLKDGTLSGNVPQKLYLDKGRIYDEVLHIVETIDLDFFVNIDDRLLPPDSGEIKKREAGEKPGKPRPLDLRRLEFMRNQPHVLFGFTGISKGFNDYYGFVFPNFIALENSKVGNAAYFVELEQPIDVDPARFKFPADKRLTEKERMAVTEKFKHVFGKTKMEVKALGGKDIRHPHLSDAEWYEKMQQEIDQRSVPATA